MQNILRAAQDVVFQEFDTVAKIHLGDLVGSEVGQFDARLVDVGELLLFVVFARDVANGDNQMAGSAVVEEWGRVDSEDSIVATA
jgi:hypothetical protein